MLDFNSQKNNCTGCSACYAVCPKHSIKMMKDEEGFLYPSLEGECVACGLCEKVCPVIQNKSFHMPEKKVLAATSKDHDVWQRSTSGGAFTNICRVWGEDSVIYGAAWDHLSVHHKEIHGVKNMAPLCRSKYVSSDLLDSFRRVRELLNNGNKVVFSGTPCQIAGLSSFLRKKYENLLLVDFICHGVGSPMVFQYCIEEMSHQALKKIIGYEFRHKIHRYEEDYISQLTFEDGSTQRVDSDQYMQLFLSRTAHRPCCGEHCKFRGDNRMSDITLADARKMNRYISQKFDKTRNYTHIIANTPKGEDLLKRIDEYMYVYPCQIENVIQYNPLLVRSVPHKNLRDEFFSKFTVNPISVIKEYTLPYKDHKLNAKRVVKLYFPRWIYNAVITRFVGNK